MRFDELLTNDSVLDGLWDMHFDECTPIQEHTIPAVLEGRDVLACAQTGTGKTAAYLLPVINELAEVGFPENAVNCVVMAPTRELAQQIDRQLQGFAYFMPVSGIRRNRRSDLRPTAQVAQGRCRRGDSYARTSVGTPKHGLCGPVKGVLFHS